jgi:hypothetical protein
MTNRHKESPPVFVLKISPVSGPVPPECRLRQLLKVMLRACGFRCVSIDVETPRISPAPLGGRFQ